MNTNPLISSEHNTNPRMTHESTNNAKITFRISGLACISGFVLCPRKGRVEEKLKEALEQFLVTLKLTCTCYFSLSGYPKDLGVGIINRNIPPWASLGRETSIEFSRRHTFKTLHRLQAARIWTETKFYTYSWTSWHALRNRDLLRVSRANSNPSGTEEAIACWCKLWRQSCLETHELLRIFDIPQGNEQDY